MKLTIDKIRHILLDIILFIVMIFIFPATFGAYLLHEKFKEEAYLDNKASKVEKAITNQKVWVTIGWGVDMIKLILIIYF